jgi:hypothetical protein
MYFDSHGMSKLIAHELLKEISRASLTPCEGSHDIFSLRFCSYRVVGGDIGLRGNIESRIAAL